MFFFYFYLYCYYYWGCLLGLFFWDWDYQRKPYQKWLTNLHNLNPPQQEHIIIQKMISQHPCQICSMPYCSSQKSCPFCDTPSRLYSQNRSTSKIVCPKCGFENDLANPICVACDAHFDEKEDERVKCQHCGMEVYKRIIEEHSTDCLLSVEIIRQHQKEEEALKELEKYKETEIECKYCHLKVPQDLILDHNQVCLSKPAPVIPPVKPVKPIRQIRKPDYTSISYRPGTGYLQKIRKPKPQQKPVGAEALEPYQQIKLPKQINQAQLFEPEQLARLSKLQKTAILYMQARSLRQSDKAQRQVHDRSKKLGFKKQDIQNLLFYIENHAPIIIHIHILKHMEFFVKDTHYRNQFETGKSSGSLSRQSRTEWENRMFDKKYASATDHERVKYGVINFTNDPKGVNCASGYGLSYFLLKQHVRNRCTMTDMDSSSATSLIGTFKYCFHILNKMNDQQLKSAFNAAKALQQSSSVTTTYKQIQIHGPIEFAKDIQRIYVNKKEVQDKKFLDMVYLFCETNKVEYEFI